MSEQRMYEWEYEEYCPQCEGDGSGDVYCGQCGGMVGKEEAIVCDECLVVTCRECSQQVTRCWCCGVTWAGVVERGV